MSAESGEIKGALEDFLSRLEILTRRQEESLESGTIDNFLRVSTEKEAVMSGLRALPAQKLGEKGRLRVLSLLSRHQVVAGLLKRRMERVRGAWKTVSNQANLANAYASR